MKKILSIIFIVFIFTRPSVSQTNAAGYNWNNVKMGGGGFVTGIITCPQEKNLMYARTDVGGAYRWMEATKSWKPLTDWASSAEWTFMGIESIAIDPSAPNKVYMSAGLYTNTPSSILRSSDYGATFTRSDVSFQINGNGMGRGNGERLAVDPNNGQILFCGSRAAGLWKSTNGGVAWAKVTSFPVTTTTNGNGICFVVFDETSGNGTTSQKIYVGISRTGADNVYVTTNGGTTWTAITNQPATTLMPQRAIKAGDFLYMTYANAEGPYNATTGAVYRYNTKTNVATSIAPDTNPYSGITVDASNANIIMLSTTGIYQQQIWTGGTVYGDNIYRSTNGGTSWINLCIGNHLTANVTANPWVGTKPQIHWASDIRIDPFNTERVMVTSGNGMFMTENISTTKATWTFQVNGLEETVPMDMASIPSGPFISVIGDYNGFVHTDPTVAPTSALSSGMGTTTSIDFAESNTNFVVVCGSANAFYSSNQGSTWTKVATLPVAGATKGSVAVSSDGNTIFWYPENAVNTYYTKDKGATWKVLLSAVALTSRPVTDRVNPNIVYSYSSTSGLLYICTYNSTTSSYGYVTVSPGTGGSNVIRAIPGIQGDVWVALNNGGLKRLTGGAVSAKLSSVSVCNAIGLGKAAAGKTYPTLYMWGTPVAGLLGIHRSDDMGATWTRINDDTHEYGGTGNGNFVNGDRNVYGRVYMSTAGRGLIYGEKSLGTTTEIPYVQNTPILYPNPASDMVYCNESVKRIEIYTLNGMKILETNESSISVSVLITGWYLARIHSQEGVYNQMFMKK
jgi:xyloglucan-specific exo-beta-1,4-glucanase